jgi:hypothetical protein
MAQIIRTSEIAQITVTGTGPESEEFLWEYTLHQLLAAYRQQYGLAATQEVLRKLEGYHGRA